MSGMSILLVGAGGHARACIDVIEQEGRYKIGGLVGLPHEVGSRVLNYPVLGTDEDLESLLEANTFALVTVGQIKSPEPRIQLFQLLERLAYTSPVIVSPRAHVSPHAIVAAGTIVMHGAIVNAGAAVGRNCILNSQSLVEHDTIIGDHCHISTAAVINSGVRIAGGTFIGSNASVRQGVRIGERCVIGMGQSVLKDCDHGVQQPAARKVS
jgi:sugar O-acyltransferase (sialic acid O-acetyltransferase NeuD family)